MTTVYTASGTTVIDHSYRRLLAFVLVFLLAFGVLGGAQIANAGRAHAAVMVVNSSKSDTYFTAYAAGSVFEKPGAHRIHPNGQASSARLGNIYKVCFRPDTTGRSGTRYFSGGKCYSFKWWEALTINVQWK